MGVGSRGQGRRDLSLWLLTTGLSYLLLLKYREAQWCYFSVLFFRPLPPEKFYAGALGHSVANGLLPLQHLQTNVTVMTRRYVANMGIANSLHASRYTASKEELIGTNLNRLELNLVNNFSLMLRIGCVLVFPYIVFPFPTHLF